MMIVRLISGLGNQLFQYAMGRQLSIRNEIPLKLDVSFFESQNLRSYRLDHYNIKAQPATDSEIKKATSYQSRNSLADKVRCKVESYLPKYRRKYFKEGEWWVFEPDIFKVSPNVYLDGYWQHYKYFENLPNDIFEELTLKETPDGHVCRLIEGIRSSESVSIHVRRGDYVTDSQANNLMGVLPVDYYQRAISYINQKIISPHYYVFSDDLDWVKDNLELNAPVTYVDVENGSKDYIELDMMRQCRHNIIANSSFSWWGAFLNRTPNKIVIAPKQWVKPIEVNKKIELSFPAWTKF